MFLSGSDTQHQVEVALKLLKGASEQSAVIPIGLNMVT